MVNLEPLSEGWIARALFLIERLGDEFLNGRDGAGVAQELFKVLDELNAEELRRLVKTLTGKYIAERNVRIVLRTLADQILRKKGDGQVEG